jgi:glycosyltransferase involved in cell wall biosynthesis
MKIVVVGTHSSQTTGYARVMRGLVPELSKFFDEVRVFGIQSFPGRRGALPGEFDARTHPRADALGFGFDALPGYVEDVGPDAVLLYNDPVVLGEYVKRIAGAKNPPPVFLYVDLVYKNMHARHWDLFRHPLVAGIFVMSECWKRELLRIPGCKPVRVATHAVEAPRIEDARDLLRASKEHVVFFNPNRNTRRKRGDLFIAAAARLLAADPDSKTSFLTNSHHEAAFDLRDIAIREFVAHRPRATDGDVRKLLDRLVINEKLLSEDDLWTVYAASDVVVTCSDGEGFGLCAAEGAAMGKAVIASAVGGAADFFAPACPTAPGPVYLLSPKAMYYTDGRDGIGGYGEIIDANDLVTAMLFFQNEANRAEFGGRARAFMDSKPSWTDIARTMADFVHAQHASYAAEG